MRGGVKLTVRYSQNRDCFAYVNSKYCTNNDKGQSIQVLWKDKPIMLWVIYTSAVSEDVLAVNPFHCKLLGLEEDLEVYVTPHAEVKILDKLFVVPDSPEDQEILEHNVELLQSNLLDQLRLVVANQKAVVWILTSMPIVFTPKDTGLLVNHSSVVIKLDAFASCNQIHFPRESNKKSEENKFNNVETILGRHLKPFCNLPKHIITRALPIKVEGTDNKVHPYIVFMHKDFIPRGISHTNIILATVEKIESVLEVQKTEESKTTSEINNICVEVIELDTGSYEMYSEERYESCIHTALIPLQLNTILKCESGQKLILTFLKEVECPDHIDILCEKENNRSEAEIIENFKKTLLETTSNGNSYIINNGVAITNGPIRSTLQQLESKELPLTTIKMKPEKLNYSSLNSETLRNCSLSVKFTESSPNKPPRNVDSNQHGHTFLEGCNIDNFDSLKKRVLLHIQFEANREVTFSGTSDVKGNILITGSSGSGKTTMCHTISKDCTYKTEIIKCRSLKGRKDIPDVLCKALLQCREKSPAVLICDDIDALVPAETEGLAPMEAAYFNRLATVVKHMFRTCSGVCVVLTATSVKALHPIFRECRGATLFTTHFEIEELDETDRQSYLQYMFNERVCKTYNVSDDAIAKMAVITAGYNFRDLTEFVNKKLFKATQQMLKEPDLESPLLIEDMVEKECVMDWGPLGGLKEVKQQLTESIFWPMMYPAMFPSQSCGILLFGPPGTGKSYIGSCLARVGCADFVSVKGPELLSKYIGQSEKAVRDIFDKADMKHPCILFFDEFDSLAPKRGHDSTGVTDRVVNQLLVRLDGAEGGARGPVIAATNRPDLVDPALLRPGRLDVHVYCPLPDLDDRVEILTTLSQSVNLDQRVDLQLLARQTDGYSPADLKAVLVTAQLTALERLVEANPEGGMESVTVGCEDVRSALEDTKPSLSYQQRLFYNTINKRFRGERVSDEELAVLRATQKQRVTLA